MNASTLPSDLNGLSQVLRAQAASGSKITLDGSVLSASQRDDLRTAFALTANADLVCAGVQGADVPAPAGGSLTIKAGGGSVLGQTGVPLALVFTQAAAGFDFVVTATMKSGWSFKDSFPLLDRFPFNHLGTTNACFVYATSAQTAFPWPSGGSSTVALAQGLNFLSGATIATVPAIDNLLGRLIGAAPLRLYGPFAPTSGQFLPVGSLRAPLGSGSIGVGVAPNVLTLANPAIAVSIGTADDADPVQDVDLLVEADLNGALQFAIGVPTAGSGLIVNTTPLPSSPSIDALIEALPGGKGFRAFIPGELSDVFAHIALDNFNMVVDGSPAVTFLGLSIGSPTPWSLIEGELELTGLTLQIEVDEPSGAASTSVRFDAEANLLPKVFTSPFDFSVNLAKQASWVIDSISGAYYGGVALSDLVSGLFGAGHSAPVALASVVFSDFGVSVTGAAGARTYTIYGTADAAIPVDGQPLPAHLATIVTRTPTGHTILLSGSVVIGAQVFSITLDLGGADSTLDATWASVPGASSDGFVSVQAMLADLGVTAPDALSGLSLKSASLSYDITTNSFTLAGDVTEKATLPLVNESFQLDVSLAVSSILDSATGNHAFSAHFEADLAIGGATFDVSFNIGTVQNVAGVWIGAPGVSLGFADIAKGLGVAQPPSLPAGVDLGLAAASFLYDATQESFTLSAESTHFGDAFFVVAKQADGNLGFVAGVDTPNAGHLSSLPGIGSDLKAADVLTFQQMSFLVSTGAFANFAIPALPSLPVATGAAGASGRTPASLASGASLQLVPGVSAAASLSFSGGSADPRFANLASIVAKPRLLLQATIGEGLLKLLCTLSGAIWIPAGGGNKLALTNPGIEVDFVGPVLTLQLSGGVSFTVFGMPVAASARMVIGASEAEVACAISADGSQLRVPILGALPAAGLGVEMGTFFEPPGVDLGLQGQIVIGGQARACAVVMELEGEVPNPLYLAFYINQANLFDVLEMYIPMLSAAAAGASVLAPSVYNQAMQTLSLVEAEDLSFHWSESVVVLPDGTVAQPGFGFSAGVKVVSWSGFAELEVSATQGVSGTIELSQVNLRNVLLIAGDGAGIKRNSPPGGGGPAAPNLQIVGNTSSSGPQPVYIVPPGGPVFDVNSTGPTFLHADWQVSLFDAVRASVDVTVAATGFSFVMTFQAENVAKFGLSCVLNGDALSFSASGSVVLQVSGTIGPIHINGVSVGSVPLPNVAVNSGIAIALNPTVFSLALHGSFAFQSVSLTVPAFSFSAAPASVAELPGLMLQAIQQQVDQIFKPLLGDVEKWADLVGRGFVTGVTDMAGALKNAYGVSAQDAARLMAVGRQSGDAIAAGLKSAFGQTNAQIATLLKGAGYTTQQIVQSLKNIGASADETASILRNTLGVSANDAVAAVKGVFTNTHVDVTFSPHADTTPTRHGDSSSAHGDVVQPPHGDSRTPHGDTVQPPHGDARSGHSDSGSHTDKGHSPWHFDAGAHWDVPGVHGDTPSVHLDAPSKHVDTPAVHGDIKPIHGDTPAIHIDTPVVHTDTAL